MNETPEQPQQQPTHHSHQYAHLRTQPPARGILDSVENLRIVTLVLAILLLIATMAFAFDEIAEDDDDDDDDDGDGGESSNVVYEPEIDPDDFVDDIDNPYMPFIPGSEWTYEAETEEGTERIEVMVLNDTKVVMGINCTVVRDTVTLDGELIEDTYDWYAQDKYGNVWYMGEDSKEYEDGEVVSTAGSWEGGVDGAKPGIIMLANPLAGMSYRQEYYEGEAADMAEVIYLNETVTIDYGTYEEVLVIREWNPLEPGVLEDKYFAPGIGVIQEVQVEGGSDHVELTEFTNG